jgi:hypothetical protein
VHRHTVEYMSSQNEFTKVLELLQRSSELQIAYAIILVIFALLLIFQRFELRQVHRRVRKIEANVRRAQIKGPLPALADSDRA